MNRVQMRRWLGSLTVVCLLSVGAGTAAAFSGWRSPFRVLAPVSLDVLPAHIAFSSTGASVVGYSVQDMDSTAGSTAYVVQRRRPGGAFGGALQVPAQQQVLGLAYGRSGLELLAGTSEAGRSCCSQVQAIGPSFGRARTLISPLAGATLARLVNLPNRLLAVIGTERGVWVSQTAAGGDRFAAVHRLSARHQLPQSLEAIPLAGGQTLVAWTAREAPATSPGPRFVYVSRGSVQQAPQRQHLALTAPGSHQIDELGLGQGAAQPTLAWIESWFDRRGNYHSQAKVADLIPRLHAQTVSSDGELAAGLAFAADDRGDQVLGWKSCNAAGACATRVVLRRAKGRFGSVQRPGSIDAFENPVAAVTAGGNALVAWIDSGHVFAASSQTTRLSGPRTVSSTNFAADLTLAAAPRAGALAVWTQGTLAQSLMGADWGAR